jgi:hypothetical protein
MFETPLKGIGVLECWKTYDLPITPTLQCSITPENVY